VSSTISPLSTPFLPPPSPPHYLPPYRLFVLLGPQNAASTSGAVAIPNVLCVLQVAFEGFISQKSIQSEMSRSSKASGKPLLLLPLLHYFLQFFPLILETINITNLSL
jgi:GNAT acetyltransferase 2